MKATCQLCGERTHDWIVGRRGVIRCRKECSERNDTMAKKPAKEQKPETSLEELKEQLSQADRRYDEIRISQERVAEARSIWESAKKVASARKNDYDAAVEELMQVIRHGPEQPGLFDGQDKPWRDQEIAVLGLTEFQVTLLQDNDPPLRTLGDLADFTSQYALTDVKGIGERAAESIEKAVDQFWVDHPEFTKPEPVETA